MEVSSWENHLFLWAIYTMAMLDNQSVRGEVLKEGQGPRTISLRCLNNPSSIGLTILNYHVLWKLLCPNRLIILPMSVDYTKFVLFFTNVCTWSLSVLLVISSSFLIKSHFPPWFFRHAKKHWTKKTWFPPLPGVPRIDVLWFSPAIHGLENPILKKVDVRC